jgi:hypothetical protein
LKPFILLSAGVLALAAPLCAQETHTIFENEQIKVGLTTGLERCTAGGALPAPRVGDPNPTCSELAVTNKSAVPITAWAVRTEKGYLPWGDGLAYLPSQWVPRGGTYRTIPPGTTHREAVADSTDADLKAAIFEDGSVFGEPQWLQRIVQNRRQTYNDTVIAVHKLRDAKEGGMRREELAREFRELQREESKREFGTAPPLHSTVPLPILPSFSLFNTIVEELEERKNVDATVLEEKSEEVTPQEIDRLVSMVFTLGKLLLESKPPITGHPVEPGEPLD